MVLLTPRAFHHFRAQHCLKADFGADAVGPKLVKIIPFVQALSKQQELQDQVSERKAERDKLNSQPDEIGAAQDTRDNHEINDKEYLQEIADILDDEGK